MEVLYHPVSGQKLICYTEDENEIIEAVLNDFRNSQLPVLEASHTDSVCGVGHA